VASDDVSTIPADGRLLPSVRLLLWPLFVVALANGAYLYLVPRRAAIGNAWPIKLEVNAAFFGAGYLYGAVVAGLGIFLVSRWRSLWAFLPGSILLGVVGCAALLVHHDLFRWGQVRTWIWVAMYGLAPFVGAWVLRRQGHALRGLKPEKDPRLESVVNPAGLLGVAALAVGFMLLVSPGVLIPGWAWPITTLPGRLMGGWYILAGMTLLVMATTARRPHELVLPCLGLALWSALLLPFPIVYRSSMREDSLGYVLWIAGHGALFIFAAVSGVLAFRWMRGGRDPL
jgi:hypothetical protein